MEGIPRVPLSSRQRNIHPVWKINGSETKIQRNIGSQDLFFRSQRRSGNHDKNWECAQYVDPENFSRGKYSDKVLFDILVKVSHTYAREKVYEGVKGNVVRYDLKPFHTAHSYLDNEYWVLDTRLIQDTTQPLTRSLFPYNLIRDGVVRIQKDSSLTDITGDSRFLKLFPEKSSDFNR